MIVREGGAPARVEGRQQHRELARLPCADARAAECRPNVRRHGLGQRGFMTTPPANRLISKYLLAQLPKGLRCRYIHFRRTDNDQPILIAGRFTLAVARWLGVAEVMADGPEPATSLPALRRHDYVASPWVIFTFDLGHLRFDVTAGHQLTRLQYLFEIWIGQSNDPHLAGHDIIRAVVSGLTSRLAEVPRRSLPLPRSNLSYAPTAL